MGANMPPQLIGKDKETPKIPADVAAVLNPPPPAGRVSCAPETDVAKFDQPNTFMKRLYERYPYLYQILKDSPPEELMARIFRDRFLSTYQVDYLHLGIGKEHFPKGGAASTDFVGDDGRPETNVIPGCSYRYNQKGDFSKQKSTLKATKKKKKGGEGDGEEGGDDEEDEGKKDGTFGPPPPPPPPLPVSEYMAEISFLGNEIIKDKLYEIAAENLAIVEADRKKAERQ